MAHRIASILSMPPVKAVKRPAYLDWIRELPCIVTGRVGVEAAHISTASPAHGHFGRGNGMKASDRWTLPLCPVEHRIQHQMREAEYWSTRGIDPYLAALVLWGLYSDTASPDDAAAVMMGMRP